MAKPAPKKTGIRINLNLLYPQGIPQKLPVKFLKWLISYGRFIVVIVEVIVLGTFAMRFKLDNDLANLKEQINSKVPYIESLGLDEALIKQTQSRLLTIKNSYQTSSKWTQVFQKISADTPPAVVFSTLSVSKTEKNNFQFKIAAQTNSNTNITLLLNKLKAEGDFQNIVLNTISLEQGQILFAISGETK